MDSSEYSTMMKRTKPFKEQSALLEMRLCHSARRCDSIYAGGCLQPMPPPPSLAESLGYANKKEAHAIIIALIVRYIEGHRVVGVRHGFH